MKPKRTIHFWQLFYVMLIIYGASSLAAGIVTYDYTGDSGWLAFAFSGGLLAVILLVVEPKFD